MATGNDDYQSTLNKMADLQDLAATVEQASKNLTANKQKLNGLITDCNKQIQALQGNIDKIKGQGSQAKAQVKELIKNANERQQSAIEKLKTTINAMSNTDALEQQLNLLKTDIDKIAGAMDMAGTAAGNPAAAAAAAAAQSKKGLNPSAAEFKPAGQAGGYTYGKRTKGKRRRRGKKSRRKGKKSKGKR